VRPNAKGKWPDQTLERRSDGLECWKPSTPRICVTSSSGNGGTFEATAQFFHFGVKM